MRGFTLLELLTALAIFALLSTMGYAGLQTVLQAQDRSRAQAEAFADLARAMTLLQLDLEQALQRPVRDQQGDVLDPLRGAADQQGLELTRGGWFNPLRAPVPTPQRVGWRVEDQRLLRFTWPVLDRAPDSSATETALLDQVQELRLRYLDRERVWHPTWPPPTDALPLPLAIEVTLEVAPWGTVRRVFRVPGP